MSVLRNKRIFKISFKFVNSKDRKALKQEFHDYSREIAIENVEKTIKLRRAKLTSEKKIIIFFSRHLRIRKNCIKNEVIAFASR